MFQNYSQTYAAAITSLAGIIVMFLHSRGITIAEKDIVFLLGSLANFGGVVWVLFHRLSKGDISLGGKRR